MSIELSGPKGYEYQYLVTAYMVITNLEEKNLQLIVEKENGEDFEISFERENTKCVIEGQVKSTNKDLDLKTLVEWLHHFADRSYDNNLISRIENDENRYALFITKGRCTDETKKFISSVLSSHISNPLKEEGLNNYLEYLSTSFPSSTDLQKKRKKFTELQKQKYDDSHTQFRSILKRVLVYENFNEDKVNYEIKKILTTKFNIPNIKSKDVLQEIIEAVKEARNYRRDAVPEIKKIIENYTININLPGEVNVERNLKETLIDKIKEKGYLLLTGVSFCGKTHMARDIAKEFQQHGYHYKEVSDVNEAERFLLGGSSEEKICIIEDPLGKIKLKEEPSEIWYKLANLITNVNSNSLVIITSKIELIKEYNGNNNLKDCSLGGHEWIDVTVNDKEFILQLWIEYFGYNNLSKEDYYRIEKIIKKQNVNNLIQPGQIRHLSLHIDTLGNLNDYTDEDIIKVATIDAEKIGNHFNGLEKEYKLVIYILGLGATTLDSLNIKEISYILSNLDEYPSIEWGTSYETIEINFNEETEVEKFPTYSEEFSLEEKYYEVLFYLTTRGYIIEKNGDYVFSHPTYQYAAQYILVKPKSQPMKNKLIRIMEKGISCLDNKVAVNFIRSFKFFYGKYNEETSKKIIFYAINAFKSIFPSVRDESLIFLLDIFENIGAEQQKVVYQYLNTKSSPEDTIRWNEGKPWLPNLKGEAWNRVNFLSHLFTIEKEKYDSIKENIANKDLYNINTEDIWNFVKDFEALTDDMDKDMIFLTKSFKTNEAFIRAKIAEILMKNYGNDRVISEIILSDPHPRVLYQGMRGVFIGWKYFDDETKIFLSKKLIELFENSSIVITSLYFMVEFGKNEGFDSIHIQEKSTPENEDIWKLWAELFSISLSKISTSIFINDSRFYQTMKKASKILNPTVFVPIIKSWLLWIEKNLVDKNILTEFFLSISEFLLINTGNNYEKREEFSLKLLGFQNTNFLAITLASYIDRWELLDKIEKESIKSLFHNQIRADRHWLKAIALTRKNVPAEIQEIITDKKILDNDPLEIIEYLDEKLLLNCLKVYLGEPDYPLWFIGTHHAIYQPWEGILTTLLSGNKIEHLGYEISLKNFINNYGLEKYVNNSKENSMKLWRIICNNSTFHDEIFNLLLTDSGEKVGNNVIELWEILFKACSDEKEKEFLNIIIENIEVLNERNEIYEIFGREFFENKILPRLKVDYIIYQLFILKFNSMELEEFVDFIEYIYKNNPPKTSFADKIIKYLYGENNNEKYNWLIELVEHTRREMNKKNRENRDRLKEKNYKLEGWNYLR